MNHHLPDAPEHSSALTSHHGVEHNFGAQPAVPSRLRSFLAERQRARVSLRINKHAGFRAKAEISNGGLLSIAVLVSSILLSTAVLVHVAARDAKR